MIFRNHPLTGRMAVFIAGPMLLAVGFAGWHLTQSLPLQQGELTVAGVVDRVQILRDASGVPHITAKLDRDAFFAMGFLHAQDRMWQLELQRRIAQGRLSEVFGKSAVQQDIWFRTLGLHRSAVQAWQTLEPAARESLQAYTDGVNQLIHSGQALPIEFTLLGIKPEPWTVFDSLAWVKVLALNLGGNYRREIERLLAAQLIEPNRLAELFPMYPADGNSALAAIRPPRADSLAALVDFQQQLEDELHIGGRYVGSNAWAVSGTLTRDGGSLLANDPHLALQIPSLWYMASIRGDHINVAGATLVGIPTVIFGHNQAISWAGTNLMADAQDLFFEQVRADDGLRYRVGDEWQEFDVREEIIDVRADFPAVLRNPLAPLKIRVRSSRHGPIISDMFGMFDQPAALRWTALDADDTSYQAFFQLNYAQDWDGFQQALSKLVAPAMNVLYGDRLGNVGHIAAGRVPIRAAGQGAIPVPGWDDSHAWSGSIPFDQWPRDFNPPSGVVVSANNRPVGDDYPHFISHDWAPPARAARISRLLHEGIAKGPLDAEAMRRIQADTHNEPAHALLATLLEFQPRDDSQRRALELLGDWQGDMAADSRAASVFNAWTGQIRQQLLADDLTGFWNTPRSNPYVRSIAGGIGLDTLLALLAAPDGYWCDNRRTAAHIETCATLLASALDAALKELLKLDDDPSMQGWAWGELHATTYRHKPFGTANVLRNFFNRRIGNGGSPDSINVSAWVIGEGGYEQDFGPGFRQVIGMTPTGTEHLYMNSTGQSGNVMSPHYDDMVEPFREVRLHPMSPPPHSAPGFELVLMPAARSAPGGMR